jgi:hypothetical protein
MPRTINDIIPPSRRKAMGEPTPIVEPPRMDVPLTSPPGMPPPLYGRPRRSFPWGTAAIALVVVLASVGALAYFSSAKVVIDPTTNTGTVSGTYTATPSTGDLPFALVNVQKTASESVPAESTVSANDAAQGTVTIYNTQAKAQPLIKNTRFETPAGLVFRIHDSVTVPAGSGVAPGTLNVTAYADSPGADYNIAPTNFTLPGLSGSPQFAQVYAKSTAPMTGGFTGQRAAVSQTTDDAEHAKLQSTLAGQMAGEVTPKVPSGYVLVPGAIFTTYATLPDAADASGGVSVREQANATAVIFPADALARVVATEVIGNQYTGNPVMLKDVSGLSVKTTSSSTPVASSPFTFTLGGTATVVWKVDQTKIAAAVAGKSRTSAQSVLSGGFPEISRATLTLRPFWKSTFPTDASKITVVVNNP